MSARFRQVFSNRHVILPVIHVEHREQAVRNTVLARDLGCDGAFLINHAVSHDELLEAHAAVVASLPGFWVGINSLGQDVSRLFALGNVDGIWVDNAGIDERQIDQPYARGVWESRDSHGWKGLYFGGVAFKYQRPVTALDDAARIASQYMDVVTTSGPGTGSAAAVAKIQRMKAALGEFPLAIASGITPEKTRTLRGLTFLSRRARCSPTSCFLRGLLLIGMPFAY